MAASRAGVEKGAGAGVAAVADGDGVLEEDMGLIEFIGGNSSNYR
jgi:hypothetical protein